MAAIPILWVCGSSRCRAAQNPIALDSPDITVFRRIVDPKGQFVIPAGKSVQGLIDAWGALSLKGRDLLLKERDVAVVVVNDEGQWFYRSTGLIYLRSLLDQADHAQATDYSNLLAAVNHPWFQELHHFYAEETLFTTQAEVPDAERFGALLARVDQMPEAEPAQKEWFRTLVGSDLRSLDSNTRTQLLLHPTLGRHVAQAIVLSEAHQNRQLDAVAEMLKRGGGGSQVSLADVAQTVSPDRAVPSLAQAHTLDIRTLGNQKVFIVRDPDRVFYVAPKISASTTASLPKALNRQQIKNLIVENKADVFVGMPGTSVVFSVGPREYAEPVPAVAPAAAAPTPHFEP